MRKIDLGENLLRDVLGVVAVAQDAVDDRKDLGLVAFHDLAERHLVAGLDAADQRRFFAVLVIHSGPRPGSLADSPERGEFAIEPSIATRSLAIWVGRGWFGLSYGKDGPIADRDSPLEPNLLNPWLSGSAS